jgi:putative peptidoglycan lipid II flippase
MIPFKHVGLAMATAISAWVNVGFLYWILRGRGHFKADPKFKRNAFKILITSLVMGAGIFVVLSNLSPLFLGGSLDKALGLMILVLSGLVIYGFVIRIMGVFKFQQLKELFKTKT